MKNYSNFVVLYALGFTLLSGCTTLFGNVYDHVGDAVNNYCEKESYAQRVVYYEEINARLNNGNHIGVICSGDPEAQGNVEALTVKPQ